MKKSVVVLNIIAASLLLLYYLLIVFGLVSGEYFGPTVSFVCVTVFLEVFLSVYRYMHEDDVTELKSKSCTMTRLFPPEVLTVLPG